VALPERLRTVRICLKPTGSDANTNARQFVYSLLTFGPRDTLYAFTLGDTVVVTYAKQNSSMTDADDNCGEQCGFVDIFSADGRLLQRLQHVPGVLSAPWGVALAPQDFGFFSHDLLIGNRFGGTIAAFDPVNGHYLGLLLDASGSPIAINGLWGIEFDNRGNNQANPSASPALFFAAGINGYTDGLFGTLTPGSAELNAEDHE
jgi:uncharacterized protein (TIGR03118 family)